MGVKISELTETIAIQDSDFMPIVQNNETKKVTVENLFKSNNTDGEWVNLILETGVTASRARIKKVNNFVFIDINGMVGWTQGKVASLPEDFYPQSLNVDEYYTFSCNGQAISTGRCEIWGNGDILITANTTQGNWIRVNASYPLQ